MKNEILQVALKQFLELGVREMSVQKLVEILGISTKTLYKYFKNKEELLEEALLLFYAREYQMVEQQSTDQKAVPLMLDIWYKAVQTKYKITNPLFQDLAYYYPELERKIETAIGLKFTGQFIVIIHKGIDEGVFRDGIHPEVVMETIYLLYNAVARTDHFKHFKASPVDVLINTIVVYIRGFCTAKGIGELDEHIRNFKAFGLVRKVKEKKLTLL